MSVEGLCQICEAEPVEDSCDRCGRLVCARHHDESSGLCTSCLAELGREPGDGGGGDGEYPDGVDEYQF